MIYQIVVKKERMPASCKFGEYKRIAIVETTDEKYVPMISTRSKNVTRVVRQWNKLNVGKTENCAFERAMKEAVDYLHAISNRVDPETGIGYTA